MAKKEKFEVKITTEELRLNLRDILSGSRFSSLVADVIVDNLSETEIGLEQLYKALGGTRPKAKFKVLDNVLIDMNALPTWRTDKEATAKLLFQGRMKGCISEINLQKKCAYKVEYAYIEEGSSEIKISHWEIEEQYMILRPDEFIDDDKLLPK